MAHLLASSGKIMTDEELNIIRAYHGALIKYTLEQCRYNCTDKKEVLKTFEALCKPMMEANTEEAEKALDELYKER